MSVDAVWAELERVRRDVATARHYLECANPDHVDGLQARLERAEAEERDLLQQLADAAA